MVATVTVEASTVEAFMADDMGYTADTRLLPAFINQ